MGLTGGIATGKSTVSGMLREAGLPIVDADTLVHALLEPGGLAVEPILGEFGREVQRPDGGIDRQALGTRVFADDAQRKNLEAIVHPLVVSESQRRLHELAESGAHDVVVYDAALLIETGRHRDFDRLVVVACSPELQLERLIKRDGLSVDQAGARVRAQMPLSRKLALADYVIDNSGHWQETRRLVSDLIESLQDDVQMLRAGRPLLRRRGAGQ
ncbi:MAG: dephospho-CoA kinase [Acidobacteriota bacterium]